MRVNVQTLEGGAFNDRWLAHTLDGLFFVRWATFADPGTLTCSPRARFPVVLLRPGR